MGLRPGRCYRRSNKRAYTRLAITVHKKNYVGAAPALKIRQFNMGNSIKEFSHILDLKVTDDVQIRDNAIESIRIAINRFLMKKIGKDAFFIKIRVFPHIVLRENKQAQGAGADRISKGMSLSFGKPVGRAARVSPGQTILSVLVDKEHVEIAKQALKRANSRIPSGIAIIVHTDTKSIGTKPSKIKEEVAEEKKETLETTEKKEGAEEKKEEKAG
ncbi:MAG: 50S ribosomal protein L16 [Candidatus Diapherotrites archaeon]|nr:50S ribosomal protein L16 [Candidatus Diapherotrites archaeon]